MVSCDAWWSGERFQEDTAPMPTRSLIEKAKRAPKARWADNSDPERIKLMLAVLAGEVTKARKQRDQAQTDLAALKTDHEQRRLRAKSAVERLRDTFPLRINCNKVDDAAEDACKQFEQQRQDVMTLERLIEKLTMATGIHEYAKAIDHAIALDKAATTDDALNKSHNAPTEPPVCDGAGSDYYAKTKARARKHFTAFKRRLPSDSGTDDNNMFTLYAAFLITDKIAEEFAARDKV